MSIDTDTYLVIGYDITPNIQNLFSSESRAPKWLSAILEDQPSSLKSHMFIREVVDHINEHLNIELEKQYGTRNEFLLADYYYQEYEADIADTKVYILVCLHQTLLLKELVELVEFVESNNITGFVQTIMEDDALELICTSKPHIH